MSVRQCKFCHCREHLPCALVAVRVEWGDGFAILPPGGIALIPNNAETRIVPCAWWLDDVCSNPACVEKAYLEARELTEELEAAA
jgi:hypothetical protein